MKTKLLKKVRKNVWIEYSTVYKQYKVYVRSRLNNSVLMYDYDYCKSTAFRRYRNAVRWYCKFYYFQKSKTKQIQIKHAEK